MLVSWPAPWVRKTILSDRLEVPTCPYSRYHLLSHTNQHAALGVRAPECGQIRERRIGPDGGYEPGSFRRGWTSVSRKTIF